MPFYTGSTTGISTSRRRRKPAPPTRPYGSFGAAPQPPALGPAASTTGIGAILGRSASPATSDIMQRAGLTPPHREGTARGPRAQAPKPRVTVGVPEGVPEQWRKTVAIQGQRLNEALRAEGIDMTGPEYLGKLIQFESGWDKNAEGPPIPQLGGATAKRLAQAIPSTRDDLLKRFGVDAYGPARQQIEASALHASGKAGYGALYAGYNPGYGSDPIPATDAGRNVPVKVPRKRLKETAGGAITKGTTSRGGLSISELIHDPGITMYDGQVSDEIAGGHDEHVHFASEDPRDVLKAARMAQRRGLEVRENPLFDPVDPVHTRTSHHYQTQQLPKSLVPLAKRLGGTGDEIGEAIDVSGGDPQTLLAYNKALARRGGGPIVAGVGGSTSMPMGSLGGGTATASTSASTQRRGPSLQGLLGRGSARTLARARANPLAARAPRPGGRIGEEEPVDEDEALAELLRQLGEF